MKWGVVRFPGSLDDGDALHALRDVMGQDARMLWHKDESLGGVEEAYHEMLRRVEN